MPRRSLGHKNKVKGIDMKNKIFLVTESLELIHKVKTFVEASGLSLDVDFHIFSKSSWLENLENPFLRSRLMDKPMLLPGGNAPLKPDYEQTQSSISIQGVELDSSDLSNVVDFPKTGRVSGQVVTLDQLEKAAIIQAIESCRGNLSWAAKSLGMGRATLYRKIKAYTIDVTQLKGKAKRRVA